MTLAVSRSESGLVSSTESNNLVSFALSASFSNPEAVLKARQSQTKPITGPSPAPGPAAKK